MDQSLRSIFENAGPTLPNFGILSPGLSYLLPIAALCGLSLLLMLLWLLAVWEYLRRTNPASFEPPIKEKLS